MTISILFADLPPDARSLGDKYERIVLVSRHERLIINLDQWIGLAVTMALGVVAAVLSILSERLALGLLASGPWFTGAAYLLTKVLSGVWVSAAGLLVRNGLSSTHIPWAEVLAAIQRHPRMDAQLLHFSHGSGDSWAFSFMRPIGFESLELDRPDEPKIVQIRAKRWAGCERLVAWINVQSRQ